MASDPLRILVLGAHPDDAEFHAGGLCARHAAAGNQVRLISVTNGAAGHHQRDPEELAQIRKREAARAGDVIGAAYETWEFADGRLQPTLEVREQIIREIRSYRPHLVLTHRTCDYHPDHRAVGQAVQDASYMVTVPLVVPELPVVDREPVVAYMPDLFSRPYRHQADILVNVEAELDRVVAMLDCHQSQVYEFLPYNHQRGEVPESPAERVRWLARWYRERLAARRAHFLSCLVERVGPRASEAIQFIEAYEISEYAGELDSVEQQRLFPGAL